MLTLQYVPYSEIESLNSNERINKIIKLVKQEKIVLMQGRLKPEEETMLIQKTMEEIDRKFKGIQLCTIFPEEKTLQPMKFVRRGVAKLLAGNTDGITIVGPESIIKEVRRDPNKIMLFADVPRTRKVSKKKAKRRK